jgi:8-oxo-dGTP pyrophosphatase MutT (NUDIX family)
MSGPARPTTAAVLVPVYRDAAGEARVVLVVRGPRGVHGGQLGLPGGKAEPGDGSPLETALRETEEEVGLARAEIAVVAELAPVDTRTTGYRVHPFVARVPAHAAWRAREGEIEAVVTPAAAPLLDPAAREVRELLPPSWPGPRGVECVAVEGHVLWGFTLRLLDSVLPRVLAGEWAL